MSIFDHHPTGWIFFSCGAAWWVGLAVARGGVSTTCPLGFYGMFQPGDNVCSPQQPREQSLLSPGDQNSASLRMCHMTFQGSCDRYAPHSRTPGMTSTSLRGMEKYNFFRTVLHPFRVLHFAILVKHFRPMRLVVTVLRNPNLQAPLSARYHRLQPSFPLNKCGGVHEAFFPGSNGDRSPASVMAATCPSPESPPNHPCSSCSSCSSFRCHHTTPALDVPPRSLSPPAPDTQSSFDQAVFEEILRDPGEEEQTSGAPIFG